MVGEDYGDMESRIVIVRDDDFVLCWDGSHESVLQGWLWISGTLVCGLFGPSVVGLVLCLFCRVLYDHSEACVLFLCSWIQRIYRSRDVVVVDEVDYSLYVCNCGVSVVVCFVVSCDVLEGKRRSYFDEECRSAPPHEFRLISLAREDRW